MFHHTVARAGRRALVGVLPLAVVAATLAGAGTASADDAAEQARLAQGLSASFDADGIGYRTSVTPDLRTISATVDNGRFVLAADASSVAVEKADGTVVQQLPTTLGTAGGNTIRLATTVGADGRSLTMTPVADDGATTELKSIATNPAAQYSDPALNGAAIGAGVGAVIGAVVCIPMITTMILYLPCVALVGGPNALIGAAIGALVGAVAPAIIPQVLP
ncbi:hypothetical protein ACWEVD_15010 [Nocardia thailandica]|uniref:DUF8020 domain-containing protein n=1 Tax=Nocardia thailandica TaxID=257275 RepID=A0ABW6PM05_9NOCA|nr:hypothetical protein [Nocardia thailandica]